MIAIGWQKAEGALMALAGLGIAIVAQPGWPLWAWPLILLAPDLAALGYLLGPRIGAAAYNAAHIYGVGMALALLGVVTGAPLMIACGGAWVAHVGADRALGYGLKSPEDFGITHLGQIGRDRDQSSR